jgi:hypothetical protein
MRLKSSVWVSAYLRRCNGAGASAVLRRRGAEEAGAIFIKVSRLDGTAQLYGPAPQTAFGEDDPGDRLFSALGAKQPVAEDEIEKHLGRELRFDPDIWIVEVEDREGRSFLDQLVP